MNEAGKSKLITPDLREEKLGYFGSDPQSLDKYLKSKEGIAATNFLQDQAKQMGQPLTMAEIKLFLADVQYNQRFDAPNNQPGITNDQLLKKYPQDWVDKIKVWASTVADVATEAPSAAANAAKNAKEGLVQDVRDNYNGQAKTQKDMIRLGVP